MFHLLALPLRRHLEGAPLTESLHCHTAPLRSSDGEKLGYQQRLRPHQHQRDADCDVFGVLGGLDLNDSAAPASSSSAPAFATGVAPTADMGCSQSSASSAPVADARPGGSTTLQQVMSSGNSSGALAAAAAAAAAQHNFAPNQAQAAQQAVLLQQHSADTNASQVRHMLRRCICWAARSQVSMLSSREPVVSTELWGLKHNKRHVQRSQLSLQPVY